MARLYADEDFPFPVVQRLRTLGHDILRVHDVGKANQGIDDQVVLADAIADRRTVLTCNRHDFKRLHRTHQPHLGIVICTRDDDFDALADRIHNAFTGLTDLSNQLVRIVRPNPSAKSIP